MLIGLLFVLCGHALPAPLPLFEAYKGSPPCFRQPVLVATPSALLAFAEGRFNTYCSGKDDGSAPRPIVMRRSTDAGVSWGPLKNLYSDNVDFLSAVYDTISKRVHLFVQANSSVTVHAASTDDGASWTPMRHLNFSINPFKSAVPAVAVGIQLQGSLCGEPTCGGLAGRLLVPFVCTDAREQGTVACPGCHSCVLVSDDSGESWSLAASSAQVGSREASLVQLPSPKGAGARVYASERNMGNSTGHRLLAVSTDGGQSFSSYGVDTLPDGVTANWTGVVSGLARFDTSGSNELVFVGPSSLTARENLTIYVSKDGAQTWLARTTLWSGPAAYSSAVQINASHVGILFENGELEFAQRISFVALCAKDI